MEVPLKVIAHIESDFDSKFGVPRQSGLASSLIARVVFKPEYRNPEAFRGIEEFSHIWIIWDFSESHKDRWSPTVRPPRLGGNTRVGVFATRSPFRPNPLGLSCVKLERIEFDKKDGPVLVIFGADMMNGTPVFDIKPYLPSADSVSGATGGFSEKNIKKTLQVAWDDTQTADFPENKKEALRQVLELDPRPAYQDDPDRIYGFSFAGYEISFYVKNDILFVKNIYKI